MKRLILFVLSCMLCSVHPETALAWGREGHETVAKLADRHLTRRARTRIERYLGNHSIVYCAKWMDEYRHTPAYGFTAEWHTAPVDSALRYAGPAPMGDAVSGLEQAVAALRGYRSLTDSAVAVNLKYIIHLAGDMHCPAHIKYRGHAMKYDVSFEREPRKYYVHHVWDNEVIRRMRIWSVSEWAAELDRLPKREQRAVAAGSPREWLEESAAACEVQFEWATPDAVLGQDFLNEAVVLVESQLQKAGYRLARILNELFD